MQITIAERLHPFSHTPGTYSLLPGSLLRFQIFPALIRVSDLSQTEPKKVAEIHLQLQGLIKDFTVQLDLERGWIQVWGETSQGFFRYRLISGLEGWALYADAVPASGLTLTVESEQWTLQAKELKAFGTKNFSPYQPIKEERLSLGNHKAQDWDLVHRRLDLKEIFPAWNRLAQMVPQQPISQASEGTLLLLKACQEAIQEGIPENIFSPFQALFCAGFQGILSPRLFDDDYQGLHPITAILRQELSPCTLLTEGRHLIHRLFIEEEGNQLTPLPLLPPEFHCGRLTNLAVSQGMIDLEWSKKTLRRLVFYAEEDQKICWDFKKQLKSCRLRSSKSAKKIKLCSGDFIEFEKKSYYFLDNFF